MALSQPEKQKILDLAGAINMRNRRHRLKNEQMLVQRLADAQTEIERLVGSFRRADPSLHRVILFGSLARSDTSRLDFDIDLAVESNRYMDLLGIALDSGFKVDLIDLSAASRYIMRSVDREGVEIFNAE